MGAIEVDGELGAALARLACAAGADDAGLPVGQLAVEAAREAAGFFDVSPVRFRRCIDSDLTALRDGHLALLAAGTFLDVPDLARAGRLGVASQRLRVGGDGRADGEQDQTDHEKTAMLHGDNTTRI